MKIVSCVQGSPEWWDARKGIPTASCFDRFIAPATGKLRTGEMPKTYAAELLAENVGWMKDDFRGSPDIERGHELESMARNFLAFEIGEDIEEVGFCLSDCGRYGSSPDGMIAETIPVELKAPDFHTQFRYLIDGGGLPAKYKAQVHGHMVVTGAPHAWFCAFTVNPKIPQVLVKVERDQFTEDLKANVEAFCDQLEEYREATEQKP